MERLQKVLFDAVNFGEEEWCDFSSRWKARFIAKNDYLIKKGMIEKYFYL